MKHLPGELGQAGQGEMSARTVGTNRSLPGELGQAGKGQCGSRSGYQELGPCLAPIG